MWKDDANRAFAINFEFFQFHRYSIYCISIRKKGFIFILHIAQKINETDEQREIFRVCNELCEQSS